jgi:hypothetical protein
MKHVRTFTWLFAVLFFSGTTSFAQTLKDVFSSSETPILYLGIDFTKAKLIDDATANASDIKERQFAGLNDLVITEAKKYDLSGALHKSNIDHDLGFVTKKNEKINSEEIKSTNTSDFHRLQESDIQSLVKGYDFGDKKGIGLLFVMEAMSKSGKSAAIWVTFIDMKSRKVLLTERIEGKTGMSFGFRNYWATGIKSVIEEIDRKKYKAWKAQYGG